MTSQLREKVETWCIDCGNAEQGYLGHIVQCSNCGKVFSVDKGCVSPWE